MKESEGAIENKGFWAGALLKTSLRGFLHGLTGTKVYPRDCALEGRLVDFRSMFSEMGIHRPVLFTQRYDAGGKTS